MPSVLDTTESESASTPNGEMMTNGGTHVDPPKLVVTDDVKEDCDEPEAVEEGDEDSDPASEEPVTVMETEEYKAG